MTTVETIDETKPSKAHTGEVCTQMLHDSHPLSTGPQRQGNGVKRRSIKNTHGELPDLFKKYNLKRKILLNVINIRLERE